MLFLSGFVTGALLMALARRRAEAIRLRVARSWGHRPSGSWEAWDDLPQRAPSDRPAWWQERC